MDAVECANVRETCFKLRQRIRVSTCVDLRLSHWSATALREAVNAANVSEECAETMIGELTSYEVRARGRAGPRGVARRDDRRRGGVAAVSRAPGEPWSLSSTAPGSKLRICLVSSADRNVWQSGGNDLPLHVLEFRRWSQGGKISSSGRVMVG